MVWFCISHNLCGRVGNDSIDRTRQKGSDGNTIFSTSLPDCRFLYYSKDKEKLKQEKYTEQSMGCLLR